MNLVEILKDVPIGTKLYSPIFGGVEFFAIDHTMEYPIRVHVCSSKNHTDWYVFTNTGAYSYFENAECLLFPSEKNRDWSTFKVSKPDLPELTPCICFDYTRDGAPYIPGLRYYAEHGRCYCSGKTNGHASCWEYIIPIKKYDFENRTFDNEDNYGRAKEEEEI